MNYRESQRREKQAFWNGVLVGAAGWGLIAWAIVWAFSG